MISLVFLICISLVTDEIGQGFFCMSVGRSDLLFGEVPVHVFCPSWDVFLFSCWFRGFCRHSRFLTLPQLCEYLGFVPFPGVWA